MDFGILRFQMKGLLECLHGLFPTTLLAEDITQIQKGRSVVRLLPNGFPEIMQRFLPPPLFCRDEAKIIEGIRIFRAKLEGSLEVLSGLGHILALEIESTQVVVSFRIIRVVAQSRLERGCCLVKISPLVISDTVGEHIAVGAREIKLSREGQTPPDSLFGTFWERRHTLEYIISVQAALVKLDNHSLLIEQEGNGNGEISAAVIKITIEDIVNGRHFLVSEE